MQELFCKSLWHPGVRTPFLEVDVDSLHPPNFNSRPILCRTNRKTSLSSASWRHLATRLRQMPRTKLSRRAKYRDNRSDFALPATLLRRTPLACNPSHSLRIGRRWRHMRRGLRFVTFDRKDGRGSPCTLASEQGRLALNRPQQELVPESTLPGSDWRDCSFCLCCIHPRDSLWSRTKWRQSRRVYNFPKPVGLTVDNAVFTHHTNYRTIVWTNIAIAQSGSSSYCV